MLSGPAASLPFIFLMADSNSPIWSGAQLSLWKDGPSRRFLNCWLRSWSACDMLSSLTPAYLFMKTFVVVYEEVGFRFDVSDIATVMWLSCDCLSCNWLSLFGELASGVPFRPWMTFYIFELSEFGSSEFVIASWRRSFQLSVLTSSIASVDSWQASIHSF